jgi:hypothetical protein
MPQNSPARRNPRTPPPESLHDRLRGWLAGFIAGSILGPFIKMIAAFILGMAGIVLILAWQSGPQRIVDATRYANFTVHTQGKIVESWVAVEFNPARMAAGSLNWRGYAKASPCAVVEYTEDWGPPARRAFCGNRFTFRDDYTLYDLREMAPGIPFAWTRDTDGAILPEIRLDGAARVWIATHPPASTFMMSNPPPRTALEALQRAEDRPVEDLVAGWIASAPVLPLRLDPRHPDQPLPAGFVASRLQLRPNLAGWLAVLIGATIGLPLWLLGMSFLLGNLPRPAATFLAILPLLALPWWGQDFPRFVHSLNKSWGVVITDMLDDLDRTGRLVASDPAEATLAGGERLVWRAGEGIYADTFGRFRYMLPQPAPASGDAALAALVRMVTTQTRALSETERIGMFSNLKRDKVNERLRAGIVFLPAAKAALLDPNSDPAVRRAAKTFLSEWVTSPTERPAPRELGYRERVRLYRELTDIPIPEIAIMAGAIVAGAETKK